MRLMHPLLHSSFKRAASIAGAAGLSLLSFGSVAFAAGVQLHDSGEGQGSYQQSCSPVVNGQMNCGVNTIAVIHQGACVQSQNFDSVDWKCDPTGTCPDGSGPIAVCSLNDHQCYCFANPNAPSSAPAQAAMQPSSGAASSTPAVAMPVTASPSSSGPSYVTLGLAALVLILAGLITGLMIARKK